MLNIFKSISYLSLPLVVVRTRASVYHCKREGIECELGMGEIKKTCSKWEQEKYFIHNLTLIRLLLIFTFRFTGHSGWLSFWTKFNLLITSLDPNNLTLLHENNVQLLPLQYFPSIQCFLWGGSGILIKRVNDPGPLRYYLMTRKWSDLELNDNDTIN